MAHQDTVRQVHQVRRWDTALGSLPLACRQATACRHQVTCHLAMACHRMGTVLHQTWAMGCQVVFRQGMGSRLVIRLVRLLQACRLHPRAAMERLLHIQDTALQVDFLLDLRCRR